MASAEAGAAEKMGYRPGLDALRAVAVALVVGVHFWPDGWLPGGFVGVDLFFVLSGFLITTLLIAELDATGEVAVGRFLWRRAVRLMPALLVMLAAVWWLLADAVTRRAVGLTALYVADFAAADEQSLGGLQHAWSLAIEEQFYLLWALAVPVVWRLRRPALVLTVAACSVAAWRTWLLVAVDGPVWFRFDARADGLLAGCALAFVLARREWVPPRWSVAVAWATVGWCALTSPDLVVLYPVAAVAAVVLVARARHGSAVAPLVWLGRRSYGIYLWHYPLFVYFERQVGAGAWRLALPVTVLAAGLSYALVEMPLRRRLVVVSREVVLRKPSGRCCQMTTARVSHRGCG